jgi:hypothetical protein
MKTIATVTLTMLMSLSAFSMMKPTKLVKDRRAFINVCDIRMADCTESITVNKVAYKISYDTNANYDHALSTLVNNMIGNARFHNQSKSSPFYVEGYIAKEKGYYPYPNREFTVFKITALSGVILPR